MRECKPIIIYQDMRGQYPRQSKSFSFARLGKKKRGYKMPSTKYTKGGKANGRGKSGKRPSSGNKRAMKNARVIDHSIKFKKSISSGWSPTKKIDCQTHNQYW